MNKYVEKTGVEGERVILLVQDPADSTKYVPAKAINNGDGTYSILAGLNMEQTNGLAVAAKSGLVAGKSPSGKQVPLNVEEDGKLNISGITVESLTATTVGISSNINTVISALATGTKTITATAAEVFAGASVKASRRYIKIKNEDPVLRLRIGASSVTQQNGDPIEPGAVAVIMFDPLISVPIYAISEGASLRVSITEG